MRWRSYVAIGDSFTEGMDDPYPTGDQYRGWADLVAARLAADVPGFGYANLAIRGRLFDDVVDNQVPAALRMRPDLVSFAAGGNDVLRPAFDAGRLAARFEHVVGTLRASGADVVLFRFADLTLRLPGRRVIGPRTARLNAAVGEVADRYGAYLVDLFADAGFAHPGLWSVDRLHLSPAGHRRVAAHVLTALDVAPDPRWLVAPPSDARTWAQARRADAMWLRRHLAPWIRRRLTGRSSGDLRTAKRPTLTPPT